MAYTFDEVKAPSRRETQYFEIYARRALYHDGWIASTTPKTAPWIPGTPSKNAHTEYKWELYNITKDFSQANDLAADNPLKLQAMKDLFLVEATKYNVLPLDDSNIDRFDIANRPSLTAGRTEFTYHEGMTRIPEGSSPDLKNRSWELAADVNVGDEEVEGVLFTVGGRFNGVGLYVKDGKPVFVYNYLGLQRTRVAATEPLSAGKHNILLRFKYSGKGIGQPADLELLVDDKVVATRRVDKTIPVRVSLDETLDVGEDTGTPVSEEYSVPFHFTGEIVEVRVTLK